MSLDPTLNRWYINKSDKDQEVKLSKVQLEIGGGHYDID